MPRYLNPNLTSYDLLKSLAVLLMILDHTGYFFFPANEWFRVVGRASMPIWFFLVGFARSRDLSKPLWICAFLLLAAKIVAGSAILPLNILFSIIFVRYVIDFIAPIIFKNWEVLTYGTFLIAALSVLFYFIIEYGTIGLLIALCGYLIRHWNDFDLTDRAKKMFLGTVTGLYAISQILIFHMVMSKGEQQAMVVIIGAVGLMLYMFQPREVPEIEEKLPRFVVSALQFGGRYTLEIYTAHLILFLFASILLGTRNAHWLQFVLIG